MSAHCCRKNGGGSEYETGVHPRVFSTSVGGATDRAKVQCATARVGNLKLLKQFLPDFMINHHHLFVPEGAENEAAA